MGLDAQRKKNLYRRDQQTADSTPEDLKPDLRVSRITITFGVRTPFTNNQGVCDLRMNKV